LYSDQKHTDRQLLHHELELLRRLSIARRSASTRLPVVRRTGPARPAAFPRREDTAGNKAGPGAGRALAGGAF
jgi:hypothetical protein